MHKLSFDYMYYYSTLVLETCLMWTLVQNNGFSLISSIEKKESVLLLRADILLLNHRRQQKQD